MKGIGVLFVVAIIAVCGALANMLVTFDKVGMITGFDVSQTGEVNLTVLTNVNINFTNRSVNWGAGRVNDGKLKAYLDSYTDSVVDGNWSTLVPGSSKALTLENIGTTNVTLNFTSTQDAAGLLGGTNPVFNWRFDNQNAGSCINVTALNTFMSANSTSLKVCDPFRYESANDEIYIYFNLTVPEDSKRNALGSIITATAMAV